MISKLAAKLEGIFTKGDAKFDEIAADPIRRRAHIAYLSSFRAVFFFSAGMSAAVVLIRWREGWADLSFGFLTAISLVAAFYAQSVLRLLRVIERLQRDREEKLTA